MSADEPGLYGIDTRKCLTDIARKGYHLAKKP